jgi:colicin import membrane protein
VVRAPPPEPPVQRDAEIALEREKQRKLAEEEERREELERQRDRQKKLEAVQKREELRKQKQEEARELAEARRREDEKLRKQKELDAKKLAQQREQDEKRVAQLREENLKRMQGMAGSGAQDSPGTSARSSGPSDSWAGRIRARVKPNIVFGDEVSGNPSAHVQVHLAPDGTITSKRLTKSSGVRSWDEAVLRALDKTEVLPRDVDGRVHSPVEIEFKPKG